MRVIAGRYGGRRLKVPPGTIRPAMDQMRESVFAGLGNIEGARFLDLFAGSGAVGLEAASRGAALVVFVESDRKKIATLKENITTLGLHLHRGAAQAGDTAIPPRDCATAHVIVRPVERYVKAGGTTGAAAGSGAADVDPAAVDPAAVDPAAAGPAAVGTAAVGPPGTGTFDYVFADPPFPYRKRATVLRALGSSHQVANGATVMIHYPAEEPLPAEIPGLERLRDRRFGRSVVTFFRRVAE
ncbi:MAG: RsmD family RNA methyltransferase [bacterium]